MSATESMPGALPGASTPKLKNWGAEVSQSTPLS